MSNIDSKTESDTHDRFERRRVRIRLLLSLIKIPRFSATCEGRAGLLCADRGGPSSGSRQADHYRLTGLVVVLLPRQCAVLSELGTCRRLARGHGCWRKAESGVTTCWLQAPLTIFLPRALAVERSRARRRGHRMKRRELSASKKAPVESALLALKVSHTDRL